MVVESNLHSGKGIVRGDSFAIRRTITRIPPGVTIDEAWLTVKESYGDSDVAAIFQVTITPVSSAQGVISDVGTGGTGEVIFEVSSANTLAMDADEDLYYDIQLLLSNGNIRTVERGVTSALAQVTEAE